MKIPDKYLRAIPIDLRAYIQPCLYGLVGGSVAVAFQLGIKLLEWALWTRLAHLAAGYFVLISLGTILATSLVAGLLLTFVSREAAGSGIPQLKIAFWRDFGYLPIKVAFAKFFAGVITIGGGCSLGREGPTVHIAGALASNIAGMLGVAKQGRRSALLSGAAAGLASAFNTPLSAITFVMEEIVEDLNSTKFLAQTLVASVTATFVAHLFLGERQELEKLCAEHPYQQFPLVIDGGLVSLLSRNALLDGQTLEQAQKPAETVNPDATIREAISKMIDKSVSLLVVISPNDETPIGIVTLTISSGCRANWRRRSNEFPWTK